MCAKGGNSVCLAGTCSEGQPKLKMFKKRIICRTRLIWARKHVGGVYFQGRGMCAKGGNSVCLAGTCSEGQPKFKMFKKRIICRTRLWEELTKIFPG